MTRNSTDVGVVTITGQLLPLFAVACSNSDQTPDAAEDVGLFFGPMIPPLLIIS
jgi:hypothetical protein